MDDKVCDCSAFPKFVNREIERKGIEEASGGRSPLKFCTCIEARLYMYL